MFSHFSTGADGWNDRPTDGWMDGRTEKGSNRVACPQLKIMKFFPPNGNFYTHVGSTECEGLIAAKKFRHER